ncbi:hypothetical protein [Catellatospora sp. NPDC049133]|uniref:hypothetical protein n=1 Tax=Catellatospora sp. NPDC049133 TaxID=3155499 RepID=UPI0033C93DEF
MTDQTLHTLPHTGLQVPHTDLKATSLRELNTSRGVACVSTLRLGSRIVGTIEDRGVGGETMFEPKDMRTFGYDEINAFATACRHHGETCSTEHVLNELVEEYDHQRKLNKFLKAGRQFVMRELSELNRFPGDRPTVTAYYSAANAPAPSTAALHLEAVRWVEKQIPLQPGQELQWWNAVSGTWCHLLSHSERAGTRA